MKTRNRAAEWSIIRRIADRLIPQAVPGRHNIVWGKP